tara:strand:+ start:478 stop:966 length:489 start_codon:yes stop_codon:yes gene_type:complete
MKKVLLIILLFSGSIFPQSALDKLTQYIEDDPDGFIRFTKVSHDTNDLLNLGAIIAEKGYLLESISLFKEVISRDPLRDKAYNNLGNCYYDLGSKEEALQYYLKAIEVNSKNEQSLQSIGQIYYEKEELELAFKYFKKSAQAGNVVIQDWLNEMGYDWKPSF